VITDVHKGGEGHCHGADVNQVAEQAILAKDALGLAEHTGYNSSSGNGVEVRHDVRDLEVLSMSQYIVEEIEVGDVLTIPRSAK
jgi:hypothetical protein